MTITPQNRRQIEGIVDRRVGKRAATREDLSDIHAILDRTARHAEEAQAELAEWRKQTDAGFAESRKQTDAMLAESRALTDAKFRELAESQALTDAKFRELREASARLDEEMARKHAETEAMLAESRKQTAADVHELKESIRSLTQTVETLAKGQEVILESLSDLRGEVGGLSRSMSYALENEAYRNLPALFESRLGIHVTERLLRTEIEDEEVNLITRGVKDGQEVLVVGEAKLRSDARSYRPDYLERVFAQLDRKAEAASRTHPSLPVIKVLVTHFATRRFLEEAGRRGVTVVQSFEW